MNKRNFGVFVSILFIITALCFSYSDFKNSNATTLTSTNKIEQKKLIAGGQSIGVKLNIEGVFVVGFSDVETANGSKQSPAMLQGIEIGDSIIDIDGKKLESSMQLSNIINNSNGDSVNFKIKRDNQYKKYRIKPVKGTADLSYKVGLWVRDSTAGVGTLTFIDPESRKFGALGHPINDVDTGLLLPVKDGKIYDSKIISVEFGEKGKPGELRGLFSNSDEIGTLIRNTNEGIYGKVNKDSVKNAKNMLLSIAGQEEIEEGPASILTSLDGVSVKEYKINIERCYKQKTANSKSMIIRITDKELLKKTGGIVQGMSGSPIIQNKKIVGAVTHVFVNKPDMGYGIYIEWMLEKLDDVV